MPEMHARVLILHTSSIQKDFKKSQQNSNMDIEEELAFQKIYNVIRLETRSFAQQSINPRKRRKFSGLSNIYSEDPRLIRNRLWYLSHRDVFMDGLPIVHNLNRIRC